jgi:Ca2+/Na+ antiporter
MNVTLGLGIVSLFVPVQVLLSMGNFVLIILMLIIAFFFFYAIRRDWRVTRREGFILLALFVIAQIVITYFEQFQM